MDDYGFSYQRMANYREDSRYPQALREQAIGILEAIPAWLPSHRANFIRLLARCPSEPGVNQKEQIIRKTMRMIESSELAESAQKAVPRKKEKGKIPGSRHPTPGKYSGARREPDAGY